MREILFRAKRVVDNEWVEGYFDNNYLVPIISTRWDNEEIDLKTLGQYTGIKDKNGVRVFEGDIVKLIYGDMSRVFWSEDCCQFVRTTNDPYGSSCLLTPSVTYEVIGNIYDNPKLLESGENK